jgi:hypothetical protein
LPFLVDVEGFPIGQRALKWALMINFNAKPVMTVDQTIESIKMAVADAK